jgi:luciferase family oxidoreductase group 1
MVPLSILDLVPVTEGNTPRDALARSLDLARHAEELGYTRYWVAEHHNMVGIASAATSVVVGFLAGGTKKIRVGAGGIMLPNHSPLVIAEQFGTLESLYPGRIDLGLGRAPGTDPLTVRALRTSPAAADEFPADVQELQALFAPAEPGQRIQAVPGAGLRVPLWILGSSLFGAQVAAAFGLPFAFASHFAPAQMMQAIDIYRARFRATETHPKPHLMLGVNIVAAETDQDARFLASSGRQSFANLRRGMPTTLPPPSREYERDVVTFGQTPLTDVTSIAMVGSHETVASGLKAFIAQTGPDELIVVSHIFDHGARVRSYEIAAAVRDQLSSGPDPISRPRA